MCPLELFGNLASLHCCGMFKLVSHVMMTEHNRTLLFMTAQPAIEWMVNAQRLYGVQVVKVAGVSLWALFREKKEKPRN